MQFLAQRYRVTGNLKGAIETEQAIAKKVEEQGRGKGLLFGINFRIVASYLTLGDVKQAEIHLNKNQALLNESKSWQNVDMFRSSWESNVEYGRARVLQARGNYRDAELAFRKAQTLQRDAIAKSPKWPSRPAADTMEAAVDFMLNYEGQTKARQGRLNEAEADIRRALLSRLKTVGKYHPDTAQITSSLASLLAEQTRFAEAEQLARTSVEIYQALGAPEESHDPRLRAQPTRGDALLAAQVRRRRCNLRPARRRYPELGTEPGGAAAAGIFAHLHQLLSRRRPSRESSSPANSSIGRPSASATSMSTARWQTPSSAPG